MTLEEKINSDLKTAMLAKDEASVRGLRAIKSAILIAKTSGSATPTEADEIKMLQKLVKQRKESAEIYQQQNREDLVKPEVEEIAVIERYLPKMMSEDEIKTQLQNIIASVGATTAADMGKVMKIVMSKVAGRAPNDAVSLAVRELLQPK